ncbi:MAG: DUF2017 family protein [Acidimicrobiia bacterium]
MSEVFTIDGEGRVVATLDPLFATALRVIARDVRQVIEAGASPVAPADDPIRTRLFPRAYSDPTEDMAEHDWQIAVHSDLVEAKLTQLETLAATLQRATETPKAIVVTLESNEVDAWIGAMNDARLVLGVQLDVGPDTDLADIAVNDPRRPAVDLYEVLSFLQGSLVVTILGGDPEQ